MKVIICGAGRVGFGIAKELAVERNSVTVIDQSAASVEHATVNLDVRGVIGHAAHPGVLAQAGAGDADMLIAVTQSDEVNMVACQVGHSLFNTPQKFARIRAQAYLDGEWGGLFTNKNLPVDVVISPELEVGKAIVRRLETPGAFDTFPFADGRVSVLGIRLDEECEVLATPLDQLSSLFPFIKIAGIRRDDTVFIPQPSDQLENGDQLYVFVDHTQASRALDVFGKSADRARRVVVIGGGNIGVYVARALEALPGLRVRMIEADKSRAERAADALNRTVVLHGDGLDQDIQDEAGARDAELVIALTNDDKVNVLASARAKREGAGRTICLINDRSYEALKEPLGIDVLIDPRSTTVSTILQHVRRGRITGLQSIEDGMAEIIEGVALDTSPLVGKSLGETLPAGGAVVGAIVRDHTVHVGPVDMKIKAEDRLVIFAERAKVREIEKLFRVALEYF